MAIEIRKLFAALRIQLEGKLEAGRQATVHPGEKGEAAELDWRGMLRDHLPWRYKVSKAHVVDSDGNNSDSIDVVVHDRQYSSLIFKLGETVYVPAESVYAVFEVKQELSKENVEYAGAKAASVRKLQRTSVRIPHAGGEYAPKRPFTILAGILCLESSWKPPLGDAFETCLSKLPEEAHLNLGCALRHGAFEFSLSSTSKPQIEKSAPEAALLFFYLRLLKRLQELATVPAVDYLRYGRFIG